MKRIAVLLLFVAAVPTAKAQDLSLPWTLRQCTEWALDNNISLRQQKNTLEQREIDLSIDPSYTFIGSPTDRSDRFKIVFKNDDDNKTFAFISNGNIIITADIENATLQVIDVMGRVIVSRERDVSRNVSTSEMTPGTYVLRLISDDKVMTQKIVIR